MRPLPRQGHLHTGGKREPGESDEAALVREIEEELAVTLKPDTLAFACEFSAQADGKPQGECQSALLHGGRRRHARRLGGDRRAALAGQPPPGRSLPVSRLLFQWLAAQGRSIKRRRT